jgi:phosphotransferase system HPr-like phosphotransfer protein
MKRNRMTSERLALLTEQAELWSRAKTLREIADATGFSMTYCQQVIQKIQKGEKITVSCGTNRVEEALDALNERL